MRLSIVILTFNSAKYIKGCLDSVYKACTREESFEILVVDNGSQDKTIDIITKYSNCRIFDFPNSTMGMARNVGLLHAKGKYIAFIDCDDRFTKNRFTRHLEILDNNENFDCVIGISKLFFKENNKYGYKKFTIGRKLNMDDYLEGKCYSLCGITYRKIFLDSNNIKFDDGIRGKYGEDWYFQTLCEIKRQNSQIDYKDSALVQIRKDSHTQLDVQRPAKCLNLIRLLEFHNSGIKLKFWTLLKHSIKYNLTKTFYKESEFDIILQKNLKIYSKEKPFQSFFINLALKELPFGIKFVVALKDLKSILNFKKSKS